MIAVEEGRGGEEKVIVAGVEGRRREENVTGAEDKT